MAEVVRTFTTRAENSDLISSWVKATTLNSFPASPSALQGQCGEQVHLWCCWEKHKAGFLHLGVVDKWLATAKRAHNNALIALS